MTQAVGKVGIWVLAVPLWSAAALFPSSRAVAEEVVPLRLHYDVYSAGLPTLDFDVLVQETQASYRVDFAAHTVGVADLLFGFQVTSMSEGHVTATGTLPLRYTSTSVAHSNQRATYLTYRGGEVEAELVPPTDTEEGELTPVTPEMKQGTADPLAAILGMARAVAAGEHCDRRVPVFDGRRRYDLVFQEAGAEELKPSGRNLFSGVAQKCQMMLDRLGGYPVDTSRRIAANDGTMWFASILPDMPPVPVMIAFDGRMGRSYVHLAQASHGADVRKVAE